MNKQDIWARRIGAIVLISAGVNVSINHTIPKIGFFGGLVLVLMGLWLEWKSMENKK